MNPIIRALYIILFIATIILNLQYWPCRQQENMLPLRLLRHMPSICLHIFLQGSGFGMNAFNSNLASTSSAKCYAENAGIKGHWDEELHGMDYLVYAYLQKGENDLAKEQYDYLKTIHEVYPVNFKDAYAFAAIPARYFLENKMWKEAAGLEMLSR